MYLPSMPVRAESSSSTSMISCTACGNVEIGIGAGRCEAKRPKGLKWLPRAALMTAAAKNLVKARL